MTLKNRLGDSSAPRDSFRFSFFDPVLSGFDLPAAAAAVATFDCSWLVTVCGILKLLNLSFARFRSKVGFLGGWEMGGDIAAGGDEFTSMNSVLGLLEDSLGLGRSRLRPNKIIKDLHH